MELISLWGEVDGGAVCCVLCAGMGHGASVLGHWHTMGELRAGWGTDAGSGWMAVGGAIMVPWWCIGGSVSFFIFVIFFCIL